MAVKRKSLPISSQAGLAAVRGGAGYQQGSPPPGAPGSRFNPRVVTREEQEARRREREGSKTAARMERHPELRGVETATNAGERALATAAEWDRRLEQAAEAERQAQG